MRARKGPEKKNIWSLRSAKSMLRQLELEAALEKCRAQIAFSEKRIAQQKETAERQTGTVVEGNNHAIRLALNATLSDIEERERELKAFRQREKSLQAQIDALAPSGAQAAHRAKQQSSLASLIIERFSKDAAIDAALQKLRAALQDRAALTAKTLELALTLDFAATADFDAGRFAALLDSLPAELVAQSHAWVNWFLGQEDKKERYTIGSKAAILPETLASANVFRPGDCIFLTKAQIAKLPSDEVPHVPTPEEMEASVRLQTPVGSVPPNVETPAPDDSFPLSALPVR